MVSGLADFYVGPSMLLAGVSYSCTLGVDCNFMWHSKQTSKTFTPAGTVDFTSHAYRHTSLIAQ